MSLLHGTARGDNNHYKNNLVGGRATTMSGAYVAVSDDASGSYYNPAGMSFAQTNSISGSAKLYNQTRTVFSQAIGNNDWERMNKNLIANFFGMLKRQEKWTWGVSLVMPEMMTEHQDQVYYNITGVTDPISTYGYNLHLKDSIHHVGPSLSYRLDDKLSLGMTIYYHYRVFRKNLHYIIEYTDGTDQSYYSNLVQVENGYRPKIGLMWLLDDHFTVGLTYAKTVIVKSRINVHIDQVAKDSTDHQFSDSEYTTKTKTPHEVSLGMAWFPSPYFLASVDFDYYKETDSGNDDVLNVSFGSEYYLTAAHAIRGGFYTNRTNKPEVSAATTFPNRHIDMYGLTAGYTNYHKDSSVTIGAVYSRGKGRAQIYSGSNISRDMERTSLSLVASASYGF